MNSGIIQVAASIAIVMMAVFIPVLTDKATRYMNCEEKEFREILDRLNKIENILRELEENHE